MQIKYRFSINGRAVNLLYSEDLVKTYELESQQRFYRAKMSGKMYLVREDYDWADSQPFSTEFVFLVEKSNNGGQTWSEYWTGVFYKTDCNWDSDDRKVELKIEVKDGYNNVLSGLDKEYNLIDLAPAKTPVQVQKRPLLQLYFPGESVVNCFFGGNSWEQDTAFAEEDTTKLINDYFFYNSSTLYKIYVSGKSSINGVVDMSQFLTTADTLNIIQGQTGSARIKWDIPKEELNVGDIIKLRFKSVNGANAGSVKVYKHLTSFVDSVIWVPYPDGFYYSQYFEIEITQNDLDYYDSYEVMLQAYNASGLDADTLSVDYSSVWQEGYADYVGESSDAYLGRQVYDITGEETYNIYFTEADKTTVTTVSSHGKTSLDLGSIWEDYNSNMWQLVEIPTGGTLTFIQYFHKEPIPDTVSSDPMTHVRGATNTDSFSYDLVSPYTQSHLYGLRRTSDSAIMFASKTDYETVPNETTIDFVADQGIGSLTGFISKIEVYTRYLTDSDSLFGEPTEHIPAEDLVEDNRNYSRVAGYTTDQVTITANANLSPTSYGLQDDGYYFVEPPAFPNFYKYFPLSRSTWGLSSVWFNFDLFIWPIEEAGREPYTLKDSSMVSDVIKVLLGEVAPEIEHEGTPEFSEFLYGEYNPVAGDTFRLMLTQKTNITAGNYDSPAQKAPVTLGSVLGMLRDTFQCYWYVEDNKLKIEHISWFKNGGGYSASPVYSADLTTLTQLKNGKPWGFESSKWNFDKQALPERFQFSWMDDVTYGFEGFPIEINSKFVQKGKVEDINVGDFTTDVDYVLLNPQAINPDGFVLMASVYDEENKIYKLPFLYKFVDGAELRLQNGYLSWMYLHPNFWVHNLPSRDVSINGGEPVLVKGVQRGKKQNVKYPSAEDPNPINLIKTHIGEGQIQKLSINLPSRMNDILLKYDTE